MASTCFIVFYVYFFVFAFYFSRSQSDQDKNKESVYFKEQQITIENNNKFEAEKKKISSSGWV